MAGDIIRNFQDSILHKVHGSLALLADISTFQQLQHGDILQEWCCRERKRLCWKEPIPIFFSPQYYFVIDFVLYKFIQTFTCPYKVIIILFILSTEFIKGKKIKREEPWFAMNLLGVNPMELNKTLVLSNKLIKVKLPLWKIWNADVSSIYGPLPFALMKG